MSDDTPAQTNILNAIHRLEITLRDLVQSQGTALRDRIDDIERKHNLEMRELTLDINKRFDKVSGDRAGDFKGFVMLLITTMVSVGLGVLTLLYHHN